MKVRVTAVRINETGQRVRPPFPVDITSLFEIDHSTATVVYREVQVDELYPLWGGLDMALDEVALTEEGKPDVTVEFRIFQTQPVEDVFKRASENLRKINFQEVEERLKRAGMGNIVVGTPQTISQSRQVSISDILPGVGFRSTGAPFPKHADSPWSQHVARHGMVGPGKRKKGKRKKGKKK